MRRLNPLGVAGVVLLVLGLAALAYQGISYTSRETVIGHHCPRAALST